MISSTGQTFFNGLASPQIFPLRFSQFRANDGSPLSETVALSCGFDHSPVEFQLGSLCHP